MTTKTKRTQRAKTQLTSEELVAKGLAMKDSTGVYSELILLYEVPGAKGWGFCGKAGAKRGRRRACTKALLSLPWCLCS